jgi:hypothetical protein
MGNHKEERRVAAAGMKQDGSKLRSFFSLFSVLLLFLLTEVSP